MATKIISISKKEVKMEVTIPLKGSMLDSEESILANLNEAGSLATQKALECFDTDGAPIIVENVKLTSKIRSEKEYQTPYGVIKVNRHVYQTSQGGKTYCPLESSGRIIQGATPKFAKTLSQKYSNLGASAVIEDLKENHNRTVTLSYLQNVCDYVGGIVQAKEESWEYAAPDLGKPVETIGISLDGAYILTVNDGYREGMVGTISLYDKGGERLHTTYIAASPEYGKETFFKRLEREIVEAKKCYKKAKTVGIADGAKNNWAFLKKHTDNQILDFWHVTEYLSKASHAVFTRRKEEFERKDWLDKQCHNLKHKKGAATRILTELKSCCDKKLSKVVRENLEDAITYFTNNIKGNRMLYYKLIKENLPIGSGVTEAACKTIIKQRLGGSGMRWKQRGIKMILSLRTLVKTKGRWKEFWDKINLLGVPISKEFTAY